jgi:aminoglycoside phosphotransferase family enzyme
VELQAAVQLDRQNASSGATVAFLRSPESYPEAPRTVIVNETHMSWVFLTDEYAYKLKKPIRFDDLDLGTCERRRHSCEEEVRLNRRLAPDVYLGAWAITLAPNGALALDGKGQPVDWVVRMRRLPAERMLDAVLAARRAAGEERGIRAVANHLARFLAGARPEAISRGDYCARLERGVRDDMHVLSAPRYGLSRDRLGRLVRAQLQLLERHALLFERRVDAGRIVEGHGDLRPEHICVRRPGAIIDCLEFSKELRVLDPLDELAFLALECERLGDSRVGQWFLDAYCEVAGDEAPAAVLHFYRVCRALRRATIAARHLDDPAVRDPERFAARARHYLQLVEPLALDRDYSTARLC